MSQTLKNIAQTHDAEFELDDNRNYSTSFWNSFFRRRRKKFEWFCQFSDIVSLFDETFHPKTSSVLHIGCGNSSFPREMVENGWSTVSAIDFSEEVINQMIDIGPADFLESGSLSYRRVDAMKLTAHFGQNSFDFVTEKGVIDDLVRDETLDTRLKCNKMISEVMGVLRPGGKFVMISMCLPHMLGALSESIVKAVGRADRVDFYPILAAEQAMAVVFPFVIVIASPMEEETAGGNTISDHVNSNASCDSDFFAREVAVHTLPVIDGDISDVHEHKAHILASTMEELQSALSGVSRKMSGFLQKNLAQASSSPSTTVSPISPFKSRKRAMDEETSDKVLGYRKTFEVEISLREVDFDAEVFWAELHRSHATGGFGAVSELTDYTVVPIGFGIDLVRVSGMATFEFDSSFDGDVRVDGKLKYESFMSELLEMVSSWESVQSCVTVA